MGREEKLNKIHSEFDRAANAFCEETGGLFCEIVSEYKGEKKSEDLRCRYAKIYYKLFALRFKYTAHGMLDVVNSILDCSVFLDKSETAVGIPLPLFLDYCDVDTETPLCIPSIPSELGMRQAFDCIGSVLKGVLPVIAQISGDRDREEACCNAFRQEIQYLLGIEETADTMDGTDSFYEEFFTLRFSSDAFIAYIKGYTPKAIKKLSKTKKLTGYERRMLRLWQSPEQGKLPELSEIQKGLEVYNQSGSPKSGGKEFWTMFFSWLILAPVPSAVYLGFYFLLVYLEGRSSVYLMGPGYNFPNCFLFGFITAIAISYFTRFRFYKLFFKSDYERYCQQDYIQNGGGADRLMKGFLTVLVSICLVGCVFLAKWNLNFQSDGFFDNTKFLSLSGEYYSYDEVKCVRYQPSRVNDFGDTLDYPSYVLVLTDGREIDFYDYDEIAQYESRLISFLQQRGVKIEKSSQSRLSPCQLSSRESVNTRSPSPYGGGGSPQGLTERVLALI